MGFLCKTSTSAPTQTTTVVQPSTPGYLESARQNLIEQSSNIANEEFQPYGGVRRADLTPDQQAAYASIRANQGAYQPILNQGLSAIEAGGRDWTEADVSSYMNPYVQNVIDIAKREAVRDDDIARAGRNARAVGAGAFGGSRQGIQEAEAARDLAQRTTDIQTAGLANAYQNAQGQFNADQQRRLASGAAFGDMAAQQSNLGIRDAAALESAGQAQQQNQQAGLDVAYGDFREQRDYPKTQADWLASIIYGYPQNTGSTTTQTGTVPGASPLTQLAGVGLTGLAGYGIYKGFAEGGLVSDEHEYAEGGLISDDYRLNLKAANRALKAAGLISPDVLSKVAKTFGVSEDDLTARYNSPSNPRPNMTGLQELAANPAPEGMGSKYDFGAAAFKFASEGFGRLKSDWDKAFGDGRDFSPSTARMKENDLFENVPVAASTKRNDSFGDSTVPTTRRVPLPRRKPVMPESADAPVMDGYGLNEPAQQSFGDLPPMNAAETKRDDIISTPTPEEPDWTEKLDKYSPLLTAGLSLMASKRPDFLGAVGEAGQAALGAVKEQKALGREERKFKLEEKKVLGQLEVAGKELGLKGDELTYKKLSDAEKFGIERDKNNIERDFRRGYIDINNREIASKIPLYAAQIRKLNADADFVDSDKTLGAENRLLEALKKIYTRKNEMGVEEIDEEKVFKTFADMVPDSPRVEGLLKGFKEKPKFKVDSFGNLVK